MNWVVVVVVVVVVEASLQPQLLVNGCHVLLELAVHNAESGLKGQCRSCCSCNCPTMQKSSKSQVGLIVKRVHKDWHLHAPIGHLHCARRAQHLDAFKVVVVAVLLLLVLVVVVLVVVVVVVVVRCSLWWWEWW